MRLRSRSVPTMLALLAFAALLSGCLAVNVRTHPGQVQAVPARPVQAPTPVSRTTGAQIGAEAVVAATSREAAPPPLTDELLQSGDEAVLAWFASLEQWVADVVQAIADDAAGQATDWVLNEAGYAALLEALQAHFTEAGAANQLTYYVLPLAGENGGNVYTIRSGTQRGALRFIADDLTVEVRPQAVLISGRAGDDAAMSMYSEIDQTFLIQLENGGTYQVAGVAYNNR